MEHSIKEVRGEDKIDISDEVRLYDRNYQKIEGLLEVDFEIKKEFWN